MTTTTPPQHSRPAPPPVLEIENLWAGYGNRAALEEITFRVEQRDLVGIIGPNGSGKSTLIRCVLGLVDPWRGRVRVLERSPSAARKRVGYVPQLEQVDWDFPVTVADVALMGLYARRGLLRRPGKADREAAAEGLRRVGMYELRHRLIGELSGGQRRRALLARALANRPALLLLDEPMAGLDSTAQHRLLDIMDELRAEGATIMLSTHDLSCVSTDAVKIACLNRRLIAFGPPSEVLTEEVLGRTFGTHLLLVHGDGQAYAYQHHTHNGPDQPGRSGPGQA